MFEQLLSADVLSEPNRYKMTTLAQRPVAASHVTVCHYDGKIYAVGGLNVSTAAISSFHAYDIASNTWATLANRPRVGRSAAMGAANGKVYVFGGHSQNAGPLSQLDIYDIASNSWTTQSPGQGNRAEEAYFTKDNELFLFGGVNVNNGAPITLTNKMALGSPATFTGLTNSALNSRYAGTTLDKDGHLLLVGGQNNAGLLNWARRYKFTDGTWESLPNFPTVTHSVNGFKSDAETVLCYTGYDEVIGYKSDIYLLDNELQTWRKVYLRSNGAIHGITGGVEVNNKLYLIGGFGNGARHGLVSVIEKM